MQGSKIRSFKNWDVTHVIILLIIKKLPPMTIHFHNFLVFFINRSFWFFSVFFPYVCFKIFIHFFFRVHLTLVIYVIFNRDLIFDSRNVFQKKKFYQESGKNFFFWNTFMIVDWKISFTFRSCIHVLNVERKLSKEKFNHMWKKNFIV